MSETSAGGRADAPVDPAAALLLQPALLRARLCARKVDFSEAAFRQEVGAQMARSKKVPESATEPTHLLGRIKLWHAMVVLAGTVVAVATPWLRHDTPTPATPTTVVNVNVPPAEGPPVPPAPSPSAQVAAAPLGVPAVRTVGPTLDRTAPVPLFCRQSEWQTALQIIREAEAQYDSSEWQAALQRYQCADAKLRDALRHKLPREELRDAFRNENHTPRRLAEIAHRIRELFEPIKAALQKEEPL